MDYRSGVSVHKFVFCTSIFTNIQCCTQIHRYSSSAEQGIHEGQDISPFSLILFTENYFQPSVSIFTFQYQSSYDLEKSPK